MANFFLGLEAAIAIAAVMWGVVSWILHWEIARALRDDDSAVADYIARLERIYKK
jgi:hypothetical protein